MYSDYFLLIHLKMSSNVFEWWSVSVVVFISPPRLHESSVLRGADGEFKSLSGSLL